MDAFTALTTPRGPPVASNPRRAATRTTMIMMPMIADVNTETTRSVVEANEAKYLRGVAPCPVIRRAHRRAGPDR